MADRTDITETINKGEFLKPCPGTGGGYLCCGYQILSPATGCGMYCRYCVLQAYFEEQGQVVYTNFSDLINEVQQKVSQWKGVLRLGTGEFGDSLFLDPQYGFSVKVTDLLDKYPNVLTEFKTKSTHIQQLKNIKKPHKSVIGFSLNTSAMIAVLEKNTAILEERLKAAAACVAMGFNVSFHFDPMVWYPQWEADYRHVVGLIYTSIKKKESIAWISMGGFRCVPALKDILKKEHTHLPLFAGEMILGHDKKLRYFRPIRIAFYRAMQDEITRHDPDAVLYMCMESTEVWHEAGMDHRIPNGLIRYLDKRATDILRIA